MNKVKFIPMTKTAGDFIVNNTYKLEKKVGGGSFGDVFQGINIHDQHPVAIKLELKKCNHPQLKSEYDLYRFLGEDESHPGITEVYFYGSQDDYNVLVMDFLGPSLEDLFQYIQKPFSLKTVLMIVDQCVCF